MKKYSLLVIALLLSVIVFGQDAPIKTDLPTIIPPSPTVAALMKFEEVPVSNYTGVPDISIPLFSTGTLSKDINLDLSLKYHPSGIAADERASDVGLGWSLFAGGTISRTVRGLPDEFLKSGGSSTYGNGKYGVYQSTTAGNGLSTNYYKVLNLLENGASSEADQYIIDDFLWESNQKGKFDTEHDLWQFNFMGFSGRFYIKKNVNNQLEVIPLDDYRVKIVNNYAADPFNSNNLFVPTGFTIYDEKGYKYVFDETEETNSSVSTNTGFGEPTIASNQLKYKSAFHLTKIYDTNNNLIIEFNYTQNYRESFVDISLINNSYSTAFVDPQILSIMPSNTCKDGGIANMLKLPPKQIINSNLRITKVKKIKEIKVEGIAKLDFNYETGRLDTNITLNDSSAVLKEIIIKNWSNVITKKFKLDHAYSFVIDNRMILDKINETNVAENITQSYELFYEENNSNDYYVGKDYWGYFNLIPSCSIYNESVKETSQYFSTTDVLQKIKYPTGGCTIFNFEANQYSHVGDVLLTDFDGNSDNLHETFYTPSPPTFNSSTNTFLIPISTVVRKVKFYPSIVMFDEASAVDSFILQKYVGGNWVQVINLFCPSTTQSCCIDVTLDGNVQYRIFRSFLSIDTVPNATIEIRYFEKNSIIKEYLYGGGNRIEKIGYFTDDVPKDIYQNQLNYTEIDSPAKEKHFNYNFFTENNRSSGSLVFAKPLYTYDLNFNPCFECGSYVYDLGYTTTTTFNNLAVLRTQGADVGYKNVTVYETNNGKIQFEYISPIDVPETNYNALAPPFLPTENYDYQRGLLQKESVYNNQGYIVKADTLIYSSENTDFLEKTGFKILKDEMKYINPGFKNYGRYQLLIDVCPYDPEYSCMYDNLGVPVQMDPNYPICPCHCFEGAVSNIMAHASIYEAYGWSKLISKTTKNYFYEGSTQKIVQTDETYTYNSLNKKIDEQTVTNSFGEVMQTKYYYHTGNSTYSQNRISEIEKVETYRGSELLSTSKINYVNNFTGNVSYLPQTIQTSKGSGALENRVRYTAYDKYGHPLEVQQENGTVISYLWGYNQSQPIAKIENATNAQIKTALSITDLNLVSEANLGAINNLRSNASFANAMITTYTYIPLVGVSTITDPKGDKITYEYDEFNRLKLVKDKDDKILSENEYHYRTQN